MKKLKVENGELVIVCDGCKALLLENKGDDVYPQLVMLEAFEQKIDATRRYGSDAPGRVQQRAGARSAVEQTNWHDVMEQQFVRRVIDRLDSLLALKKIAKVIIVAPPRALGTMRAHYSPALKKAINAEIAKDLVALSVYEIEQAITK